MNVIEVLKDEEIEHSIPSIWRPIFSQVVDSLVKGEYSLGEGIASVVSVPEETAKQIQSYIED